ncbi:small multidrug efflux protein [Agreia sp. COWG]|uniref:small multidrug efflux protein n=1 Tax=Agreia sp. COWG TaxID=2773266 RepID=UPI0019280DCF|nr:small multidrug efflux protein [Agreia sp. COWG]CAD5996472.1 Small multidrug efflux protein [Agreia sp. COWG]
MDLISRFQDLVAQVPEVVQPLIVALAGAVPFIEGEGAATIGIIGGVHPVAAVIAGAVGNFLCVLVLVTISSNARSAIVNRRRSRSEAHELAVVAAGTSAHLEKPTLPTAAGSPSASGRRATRKAKFQRALDRYGVPGVSLLGPLLLPTQFTATMLTASGVSVSRVLLWQGLAIVGWTTLLGVVIGGVVHSVA